MAGCGSVYDTNQPAPAAWVATYNQPSGGALQEASPTGQAAKSSTASAGDAETRLLEAAKLREDGLISETEYQQLRKRILGSL